MSAPALRASLLATAILGLVVVAGGAARVVLAPAAERPEEHPVDAVVAIAGDQQRLHVAGDITDSSGGTLVISWVPGADDERDARCQEGAPAICFVPHPVSTAGEARAIGHLSAERGWDAIVVVTSRYHVGRTRMLVGQCVDDADVRVVSATDDLGLWRLLQESMGVVAGFTLQRAC